MRSATRDLLRLSLTASAVAGILLYAELTASRFVAPEGAAVARTDSLRYFRTNFEDRSAAPPSLNQPKQVESSAGAGAPADPMAKPSGKSRLLLALEE